MGTTMFTGADVSTLIGKTAGLTKAIHFQKADLPLAICQQIQAQVQVQVNTYYEVGSEYAYRVMGKPQGSGSISNIMGPTRETVSGLQSLCDLCDSQDLYITFFDASGCNTTSGGLVFKDCTCTSVGATADAAQDLINGSWSLVFTDVEME